MILPSATGHSAKIFVNIITIKLPALRERKEDIELLVKYFIKKYSDELGKPVKGIEGKTLKILSDYHWPGNIRELQNIIERAVLISDDENIRVEHLPEGMLKEEFFIQEMIDNKLSIEDYTKAFIRKYQSEYNEQQIAAKLGITRKSLWGKRKKWGISK